MNCLLTLLLILILSIIYAASEKTNNNKLSVLLLVFLIITLFGYMQIPNTNINRCGNVEPFMSAPVDYVIKPNTCDGVDYEKIDVRNHHLTDSYDGLVLKETKPEYSKLSVDKVAYFKPTGEALALNLESNDPLFMFAYNKSHPSCCPSTYSSSRGCVCMTEDQKNLIRFGKKV